MHNFNDSGPDSKFVSEPIIHLYATCMVMNALAVALFISGLFVLSIVLQDNVIGTSPKKLPPSNTVQKKPTLNSKLKAVIRELREGKSLPMEWAEINKIDVKIYSDLAKELFSPNESIFPTQANGNYRLELEFFAPQKADVKFIIVQFSLFETNRQNKFWEYTKNIDVSDLLNQAENKKKPDEVSPIGSK